MNRLKYFSFVCIFIIFNSVAQQPNLVVAGKASDSYKQMIGTLTNTTTIVSCAQIKEAASLIREFEKFKHMWRSSVLIGVPIGIAASRQESFLGVVLLASCVGIGSEIFLQIMQKRCQNRVDQLLKILNDLCANNPLVLNMPIVMDTLLEAVATIENEKYKEPFYTLIREIDLNIRCRLDRFGWSDDCE